MLNAYSGQTNPEAFDRSVRQLFGNRRSSRTLPIASHDQDLMPLLITTIDNSVEALGNYMISPSEVLDPRDDKRFLDQPSNNPRSAGFGVLRFIPSGIVEGLANVRRALPSSMRQLFVQLASELHLLDKDARERAAVTEKERDAQAADAVSEFLEKHFGTAETSGEVFVDEVSRELAEALPALLLLRSKKLPASAGEFVTAQLGKIKFLSPAVSRAIGGAVSAMTGAAEISAASTTPEVLESGDMSMAAEAALRPFVNVTTATGKIATGRIGDVTVEEWVDLSIAAVGTVLGGMQRPVDARIIEQNRPNVVEVLSKVPEEKFAQVEEALLRNVGKPTTVRPVTATGEVGEVTGSIKLTADAQNEIRLALREAKKVRSATTGQTVGETVPAIPEVAGVPAAQAPTAAATTGQVAESAQAAQRRAQQLELGREIPQTTTPPKPKPKPFAPDTSARMESMARDRALLGLDELNSPSRRSWERAIEQAQADGIPERAMRIAAEVNASPRSLSDVETAGVVIHAAKLKNEHAALVVKIGKTEDPAEIATLAAEITRVEQEFDTVSAALRVSGTEKGRSLASQKLTIDQDFNLISVLSRARAAAGREVPIGVRQQLAALTEKLNQQETELANVTRRMAEMEAEKVLSEGLAARPVRRRVSKTKVAEERNALMSRAKELLAAGCKDN